MAENSNRRPASAKRIFAALLAAASAFMLGGCWDRQEINDLAFIMATAIDKEPAGYRISVLIPLPGNLGGPAGGGGSGGSGGQKPFAVDSETGVTIAQAANKLQSRLSRKLYYAHRRVLLYGEDVAKDGLEKVFDSSTRLPENRLATLVAVTKGKASDMLAAPTRIERFPTEAIREMLQSGIMPPTRVKDVAGRMNTSGNDAHLPYLELVPNNNKNASSSIEVTGCALTSNGKMVEVLKGNEAIGYRWLQRKFVHYVDMYTTSGQRHYNVEIDKGSKDIKPRVTGNDIQFDIKLNMIGYVLEASPDNEFEKNGSQLVLEQAAAEKIKRDVEKAIEIMKRTKSDAAGFGQYLNRAYPARWNAEWKDHWYELFATSKFNVTAKVSITRIGVLRKNISERSS